MNDETVDLLDLDDGTSIDNLPDATPFAVPRPRKPWLLLGVGVLVIILATYIIIRTIGSDSSSSMEVDLDAPVVVDGGVDLPVMDVNPNPMPVNVMPDNAPAAQPAAPVAAPVVAPAAPKAAPKPVVNDNAGVPTRVVEDRNNAAFNPEKPVTTKQPVAAAPAKKTTTAKTTSTAAKTQTTSTVAKGGSWYVQFGSYSSRALAESAQRQIRSAHSGLFQGKQFVILAAVLPNGSTVYRLRVVFATSADANGFCRNAKSDGLDCYVAK